MNRYPLWKYLLILFTVGIGVLFALPNLYDKEPALQISSARSQISQLTEFQISAALEKAAIDYKKIELGEADLTVRFNDIESQLKAKPVVETALGRNFSVALNLVPATPNWLNQFGAEPMFLGLDLRGGVHLLMEVDMQAAIAKAEQRYISDLRNQLREEKIRYKTVSLNRDGGLSIRFQNEDERNKGQALITENFADLDVTVEDTDEPQLLAVIKKTVLLETQKLALQQNITTLRKRVNELGVAEPIIQQQGSDRIVVQLPGIQDIASAKAVLGSTATLEFRLVDDEHNPQDAVGGRAPAGSKLYYQDNGSPILLRKQIMLTGDSIINARSGIDQIYGKPNVSITLDGKGAKRMEKGTKNNIKNRLAVVFIENTLKTIEVNGETITKKETIEEVINAAEIQEQLSRYFQITNMGSAAQARTLALLLRAGALAAPVYIVEERTVGPSLGKDNIDKGVASVKIGFLLVLLFMGFYYKLFGLIANIALTLNLIFIVAMLSLLSATLTLPGIAGIVLTVGMAVDANVLIFERIREEIRNGNSPQASIYAGYEKAFSTIADSNITTLIAALMLFSFGTGPIKGFAVTLSLGIISSMFTAIIVSRGLINLIYGGKRLQKLAI